MEQQEKNDMNFNPKADLWKSSYVETGKDSKHIYSTKHIWINCSVSYKQGVLHLTKTLKYKIK